MVCDNKWMLVKLEQESELYINTGQIAEVQGYGVYQYRVYTDYPLLDSETTVPVRQS